MRSIVSADLDENLDDAERLGICLFDASERERQTLITRVDGGLLVQPLPGLFSRRSYWDSLPEDQRHIHLVRTLGILHPTWTFSYETAGAVYGIATSYRLLSKIHVSTSTTNRQRGTGPVVRHASKRLETQVEGRIRVTPPAKTVIDCCRTLGFREGLAVADAALRADLVSREMLAVELRSQGRQHGIRLARTIVSYADGRSENGGESIARAAIIELGYATPKLQVELRDPLAPGHVIRLDYLWRRVDGSIVAGELDGNDKYVMPSMTHGKTTSEVLVDERQREPRINALGIPCDAVPLS
jgi:hypothetical protein